MIKVERLNKFFGEKQVLKDISVEYQPGKCSLIIGASGSGKTVLLKSIVGLHKPESGAVWYGDINFTTLDEPGKKEIRKEIELAEEQINYLNYEIRYAMTQIKAVADSLQI